MGQDRGQGSQVGTSGTQGHIYTVVPSIKQTDRQLYKVCFFYLAYRLGYYLILVHHIHSSLHHV